jgi:hypothetical protein
MFDIKNRAAKVILSCPIRCLVRLQGKLRLTEKEKYLLHIRKFLLYFSILQFSSHQQISVADLG